MKSPSFAWEIQSAKRAHTQQRLKTQPKVSPAGYPDEDTLGDIERHLVNEHNPTLLHAKRMGQTANVIVVFQGSVVPHYVYYNRIEHGCVLYKNQYETCYSCGRLGHRSDV